MILLRRLGIAVAASAAIVLVAACGGSPSPGGGSSDMSTSHSLSSDPSRYLTADPAGKTVTLKLVMTGFNFDAAAGGKLTVTVPQGWKVSAQCINQTTVPHSCAIVSGSGSTSPVFAGAATANPESGVAPNQSETFTFTTEKAGSYRIACLVPGHVEAGMWDKFVVSDSGSPSITTS
jgi:sulfocyanin